MNALDTGMLLSFLLPPSQVMAKLTAYGTQTQSGKRPTPTALLTVTRSMGVAEGAVCHVGEFTS